MRYTISRIFGTIIAFPVAVIAWFTSVFALDIYVIFDFLISAVTFLAIYFPTQRLTSRK
ncbi:MAG: 5-bromo-4-chloroindolyl phosphate hydrolase, partial [Staphylococcus equorum]|nr:5-bromo-4-chloroindolyl phosphate hydrolase [Staphylococcus equorum]